MSRGRAGLRVVRMRTPSTACVHSTLRTLAAALTLPILAATALDAQAAIGLSGVRAQAFFNEEIDGFPPEQNDFFAWRSPPATSTATARRISRREYRSTTAPPISRS